MLMRVKQDLTMAEAARTPGGARVDLLAVAEMVACSAPQAVAAGLLWASPP